MCGPAAPAVAATTYMGLTAATWTAIGAGVSTLSGLKIQHDTAKGTATSNKAQEANALQARADNSNQIVLAQGQQHEAATQKIAENNIAMKEAQGTAVAGAGYGGLSLDNLLKDMGRKAAGYNESVLDNNTRANQALDSQQTNVNRNAASEINSLKVPVTPDYLGAALSMGQTYKKWQG